MTDDFLLAPRKPKVKKVREIGKGGTEQSGREEVARRGGRSLKWVSPGHTGVPDQIELYGVDAMAAYLEVSRATAVFALALAIQMTEYKSPGKQPKPHQLREHERLRATGFTVNVVDKLPESKA